jgi:hypothetical protein
VELKSGCALRGDITIRVINAKSGEVEQRIDIRNMIMYDGLIAILTLLAQLATDPAPSTLKVSGLRVGTSSTAPARTQHDCVAPVYTIALVDANLTKTTVGTYELRIAATLPNGTGGDPFNGVSLTEAGIILGSSTLFARQIHPAIAKNTSNIVEYDWRISLTA